MFKTEQLFFLFFLLLIGFSCRSNYRNNLIDIDHFKGENARVLRLYEDSTFVFQWVEGRCLIGTIYIGEGKYSINDEFIKFTFIAPEKDNRSRCQIEKTPSERDSCQIKISLNDSLWRKRILLHNLQVMNKEKAWIIQEARMEYPSSFTVAKSDFPLIVQLNSSGRDDQTIELFKAADYSVFCYWFSKNNTTHEQLTGEIIFKIEKKRSGKVKIITTRSILPEIIRTLRK